MIKVLLVILLGTMLSGMWFGVRILFELLAKMTKVNIISRFSTLLAALVPTIIIARYSGLNTWNWKSVADRTYSFYNGGAFYGTNNQCAN